MCPDFPQKWQTHTSLSCVLPLGGLGALGLDSWRSTLIFLGGVTSTDFASLTEVLEEEEGTEFVEWDAGIETLSTKPKPVCQRETFEHLGSDQVWSLQTNQFVL